MMDAQEKADRRALVAALMMQGLLSSRPAAPPSAYAALWAFEAVAFADALLTELDKPK